LACSSSCPSSPFTVTFFSGEERAALVFDGTDLLTTGDPAAVTPTEVDETNPLLEIYSIDRQPFAIAALAVLVAALFTGLIRDRITRHASAVGLAVLTGAVLLGAYLSARRAFEHRLIELANDVHGTVGPHNPDPGIGLWLMIGTLELLVIGHAMAFARAWDRP
jgi:hypothetical protein